MSELCASIMVWSSHPDIQPPTLPGKRQGVPMQTLARRLEDRMPVAVRVDLWSLDVHQRAQECVTENISTHGARVVSSKPWKRNERLNLHAAQGQFRARARVAYCEPLGVNSFAIGLRLLAATGNWN